ncbi:hypothetical protein PJV89_05235 [Aliarcobacter butzleri]|uniref:hypothetical protein n=1 Tax=Aliarcobacter butzleri TaxID=28197 RepID=UPI00263E68F8|nr:hypothetical protein [Aliarcobacter butzleri]MDN5077654.1 hypothetical protein [Aliarcobacter butzleri]MDN5118798.1 hypothetical protein [Aliarcobacter butzleri]
MSNDEVRLRIKIDAKSQELILMNQQVKDLGKSFSDTDSFANTFLKRINIAGHIYAGFQVINNTLGDITRNGIEVNRGFQKLTNSLTISSAAMISNNDIYGNAISVQDKYRLAQIEASKATELLQKANINTPHSLKETVQIYDAMYIGMKKVGATTSDMVEITEKLSIAVGNKIEFGAFLSAMDGISTGTVEVASEMGRALNGLGLSNEVIKESTDVVQLFKDKLSGFQAIQDFDTKMSNLSNSTDMFSKNLMKIPFDYLESKIPSTAALFDSWAKSINEINVYLSNASSLSTYDELINKQYQLLGQISEVKNDKFMWDSEQKTKLKELNSELEIVFQKLTNIKKDEDLLKNVVTNVDTSEIDKLVNETLDPYSGKIDEINSKWLSNFNILVKNGKDTTKYVEAWAKALDDVNEKEDDKNKKALEALKKSATEQNKAYLDISKIGMSEYEKALLSITEQTKSWLEAGVKTNDALAAQSKLIDELNNKKVIDTAKEDLSYYERLVQLKSDSYEKEIELANIAYTQKALDIQGLNRPIEDKEKLLDLETQLYNKTLERVGIDNQINGLDEASNSYQDMLEAQIDLLDATNDWNSNLTGTAAALADVASATGKLSKLNLTNLKNEDKLRTEYEKNKLKFYDNEEELKKIDLKYTKDKATLDEKNISATLLGYSNIAGALSSMYDEGSRESAAFQIAQSSLALVEGTRAILTAGTGDPYTAIPRMIAMGAMVSSLLSNIGIAFGTSGKTNVINTTQPINDGTGSVLGDSTKPSESIINSLSILEDFAQPQFQVLSEMNKNIKTITDSLGGVTKLLIQQGGFAFGEGYTGFDTGFKNKVSFNDLTGTLLNPINSIISKIPVIGQINGLFQNFLGSALNKVLGGLFGKTSVSQALTDSGLYFSNQLLSEAIKNLEGSSYQTVLTIISKNSWTKKSTTAYFQDYFQKLDNETTRQFSLVLSSLYDTVLLSGEALDSTSAETAKSLEKFVVSIGKISLKGKTSDQIQETLTSIFGKIGDDLTKTTFPLLVEFQKVGEGLFETLTRVATGMEEAEYYASRLGNSFIDIKYTELVNKQGKVGFEALLQIISNTENALYPMNNGLLEIIKNLNSTTEELYSTYLALDELRDRIIFLGQSSQGLTNSMIYGAGSVGELQTGFKDFFENFLSESEQLTYNTQELIKKFNNINLTLPTSKDSFKALLDSLDLTTASGQELYGRLIILSGAFAEVSDATQKSITSLQESLDDLTKNSFDTFVSSIDKIGQGISNLKNIALGFLQSLNNDSSAPLEKQIISYNKLRGEFESYFDAAGNIKDGVNTDSLKNIYSQMSSLGQNISKGGDFLKDSLVNQFEKDLVSLNFNEDVIRVNIVDGLGTLYNLSSQQLKELKSVAADGKITNSELDSISGLTQEQKKGIIEFANSSSYFSTEDTLQNLANYAKLQLDAYNQQIANETAKLSSQTFTYDDYIGKQEKIDIAKTLGISYESAEPLIKQLQSLSILDSSAQKSSLSELLKMDMSNFKYDKNTFNQLELFSPYLDDNVKNSLNTLKTDFETSKLLKVKTLEDEIIKLEASKAPISPLVYSKYESQIKSYEDEIRKLESYKTGQSANTIAYLQSNIDGLRTNINNVLTVRDSEISSALSLINSQISEKQSKIKSLNSFAVGSARIEYDQLAQLHKDEIVAPKTFSDGIRNGDLVMGDNNKVVEAINSLKDITVAQAREIQKMKEALDELNTRDLIKTAKGVA